ncbi:MAG: acetyl-CoA carboxylase biotin carboxylase subunit [Candidatus Eremiobacteraeota bacterium]|nr:acetyl-CoA carboxylase biotin carboxylase subunit [Candidatus Eremiobacteraeota bacterium]
MIARLLIANRGEIAVRIARAAREMGIVPLGIYSQADEYAYHREFMDESICIGAPEAAQSYLDIEKVIAAAKRLRADAVHPGYGFLSERPAFAQAALDAGLIFVGPSPPAMAAMGSKIEAKKLVRRFDVPVVPGYDGADQKPAQLRKEAEQIGTPLLIKASAGGGGRGMRVVSDLAQFDEALDAAKREAQAAFGDSAVLLERYLERPRHIEFQILADTHGTTLHLGERECSIQRRHQKIIEEAPSVAVTPELRDEMGAAAVRAAKSVEYVGAGTVEFMLDSEGRYYFLEMNTRLQVEHPVTELAYGIDLVQWQLRIANGEPLAIAQVDVQPRGWAIEARIYAEDPANKMLPSTGTITAWQPPEGPGIRLDSGVRSGNDVSVYYDPMLAKLIVWGADRISAIDRMERALRDFQVSGVRTNIPLLLWIMRDSAYRAGDTTTAFLSERLDEAIFQTKPISRESIALAAAAMLQDGQAPWRIGGVGLPLYLRAGETSVAIEANASADPATWQLTGDLAGSLSIAAQGNRLTAVLDGQKITGDVEYDADGFVIRDERGSSRFSAAPPPSMAGAGHTGPAVSGAIRSPMPGKIVKVLVAQGEPVEAHTLLIVLEAMKMEHRIEAPSKGTVKTIFVKEGEIVAGSAPLLELT